MHLIHTPGTELTCDDTKVCQIPCVWKQEDYACSTHHSHLYASNINAFAEQHANPEVDSMARYSLGLFISY
jgi:hypothetical protein